MVDLSQRTCSIPDCDRSSRKRGWCQLHYSRWLRHGDPLFVKEIHGDDEARLRSKIERTPDHWEWTGTIGSEGYGFFRTPAVQLLAHRVVWEWLVGPIPEGLTLDHIKEQCGLRSCVKVLADDHGPAHLEPVTRGENTLRGDTITAANRAKTHCLRGHPFDAANTGRTKNGWRYCRACRRPR